MLTHCPACETHFRVTTEQLKVRSGRVRCGECQHVFNALDSLIEEPMVVLAPPTPQPGIPAADVPAPFEANADQVVARPAPVRRVPPETIQPVPEVVEELPTLQPEAQEPSIPKPTEAAEPDTVAENDTTANDWSETFPEPPPPPRRWPWVIGSLVALVAIGLQAVLAFRVELAVLRPEARPALVALCNIVDCEVGLPAKAALMGIEASDLHPDTAHAGQLTLTATLKNRAPFAQQFPHLELTLTDTADKAVARKVLAPADYLPPATAFALGMQANADTAISVGIAPGEIAASGYRLYLFYP